MTAALNSGPDMNPAELKLSARAAGGADMLATTCRLMSTTP
jgi:hypothetical protein